MRGRRLHPGGRGGGAPPRPTRLAREAALRRERARTHLARLRARGAKRSAAKVVRVVALWLAPFVAVGIAATTPWLLARGRDALRNDWLALERVAVEGTRRIPAAEIARAAGVSAGVALVDVNVADVEARVLAHPWIGGVRALRLPPSTLLVRVEEREPVATAKLAGADGPQLVDREGVAFALAAPADLAALPRIVSQHDLASGPPSAELATAARLVNAIADLGLAGASEIGITPASDPEGFWLRLRGGAARAVLGRGELDEKLARLAELLAADRPETAAAARIDLRFRDQVVLEGVPPRLGAEQAAATRGRAEPSTTDRSG